MALTVYTNRTLGSGYTQQQLYDELKAAMQVAGFSAPVDENGSAGVTMELVFAFVYNALAKGTVFLKLQITPTLLITPIIFDTHNNTTNTGTNACISQQTATPINTSQLNILTVNNPEMRGICLTSGTTELGFLGLIRPATKPVDWDEALYSYSFVLSATVNNLRSMAAAVQPNINGSSSLYYGPNTANNQINIVNILSGRSDIFPFGTVICFNGANGSYAGAFTSDLALVQGAGRLQGDTFDNKWIYLGKGICHRYAL
jgi:hypothetical protein